MDWNRRKSTRCVWSALVVLTFVVCVALVYLSFTFETDYSSIPRRSTNHIPHSEKLTVQGCTPVCGSKECVLQSKILLEYVQPTSDPCDNFYKFACGKYLENHFEQDSVISRGVKRMRIHLRNILESLEPIPGSVSEKLKNVYDSCVKQSSEIQAVPTLLQMLDEIGLENWPNMNSDFKFENVSLTRIIANLLVYDEYGFVLLYRYDNQSILRLSSSESSYEMKNLDLIKFQTNRILKNFKFDDEAIITIQEDAEAMHSAIKHLAAESLKVWKEGVITESKNVNCSEEMENMELCEILDFFVDISNANKEVNNEHLYIHASDIYFAQNIFPLLRNFTDRSVANYLAINVILNHLNDLNIYLRLTYQKGADDVSKLDEKLSPMDRWQYCVDWISGEMTLGLMHEYMNIAFVETMLKEVTNLTDEMIHETAEYFSRQEWVSENLRKDITEEIRNIFQETPHLKNFTTETFLNKLYGEFRPEAGSLFLRNVMEFRKLQRVLEIRGLQGKEFSRYFQDFFLPGATGGGGQLSIKFGILFPPTYSPGVKRIFNLASLGMIIVHEIGHSIFDGSHFMQFGQEERDHFMSKMKCIVDQVSQYRFEFLEKSPNGTRYAYEDIADNAAVPIIDKMIEKYLSEGNESNLPGLNFSMKQLLYTSTALTWCSVSSKEKEELVYSVSIHSPEPFRVYQLMKNSKGFPDAFHCPVGSPMNPADKCLMLSEGGAI